ncbi:MAG: NADH-quinone oxidoreductase subunit H, partial [Actinomycetes bacterium]|nr:NADH-quinone oxidoreductase subunit H [Actinomycetes bacterium]
TLFLGGWRAPWPISAIGDGMFNEGWWPMLWFITKVWLVMFLMIWTRGTLLRFRYDQFMRLGWKVLIPVALAWVVMVAAVQGVRQFAAVDLTTMLLWIAGVFIAIMAILLLWPAKKEPPAPSTEPAEFDAFAGGFPVPPMPGQELPPSPRRRRREAAMAMNAQEATDE